MATAQLPTAATQRAATIRDGLADIRRRTADLETLATWSIGRRRTSLLDQVLDRALPRRRRPVLRRRADRRTTMLAVVLGILAGVGIVAVLSMIVLGRRRPKVTGLPIEAADDETTIEVAGRQREATTGAEAEGSTDNSFPASDPIPTPMTPGIGAG